MKIKLDGERIISKSDNSAKVVKADILNSDIFDNQIIPINQPTELGESLKHLNDDSVEQDTRMSGIDMRANIHPVEKSPLLAIDIAVALGVLPKKCLMLSRQSKRLSVSVNAMGRNNIVDVVSGKQEQDARKMGGGSILSKIGGIFSSNNGGNAK